MSMALAEQCREVSLRSFRAPMKVCERVWQVGGPDMSDGSDCCVYLVDGGGQLALVDSGCGPGYKAILANIIRLGFEPRDIDKVLLTHCHIDHVGAAAFFRDECGASLIAHEMDAGPLESGDRVMTAAFMYNVRFKPLPLDTRLEGERQTINVGDLDMQVVATPGHTPGSVSAYLDLETQRVLFGQDIHGPFHPDLGSDIAAWRTSMEGLLELRADILCEGHFGVYSPEEAVSSYIRGYLDRFAV